MRIPLLAALAVSFLFAALSEAAALTLKPFKDELFAYPGLLAEEDRGARLVVDYRELRDINQRDEVPERRVKGEYVRLAVRSAQKDLSLKTGSGEIRHFAVGKPDGASAIVVYLHGKGGSRRQGVDDFTFGGNFNRIKNLMWENGGLYLSPDFTEFGPKGVAEIAALLDHYASRSPGAPIFAACGSMGGAICWGLADDPSMSKKLAGLLLLGSFPSDDFAGSAAYKRKVPLYLGQGSKDTVFPVETQEAMYRRLKSGGYPVRFVRFETGTHGTPIRMTDWRDILNWMLSR
ncbi:MAG: alpha/beta hydrolase [Mesorhizobium sp.]|nr:alpha/beta hydrolase [Mesorhizobium sp.]MCO5163767.1 alpha/beta hydrolase [Mesorhizobium sp.]